VLGDSVSRVSGFHGDQFDPEVTQPVQQPVQVRLVTDVTDQHCPVDTGFQGHTLEGGLEVLAQAPTQDDAISARGHESAPVLPYLTRASRQRREAVAGMFLRLADCPGGVDQADMTERLREISDHLAATYVDLLG